MLLIKEISKKEAEGRIINFTYLSEGYYDLKSESNDGQFQFIFNFVKLNKPIKKQFEDHIVSDYMENPIIYYAYIDDIEVGYLTLGIDNWNQRLRIWNILVLEPYRNLGVGKVFMAKAKEVMKNYNLRSIILETQSCNDKAIKFYLDNGFKLVGFDKESYSNYDVEKKEVRMEFSYSLEVEILKTIKNVLLTHINEYPKIEEVDLLKLLYQSEFGPGHLIKSKESSYNYLVDEINKIERNEINEPLFQEVQGNLVRVNLRSYLANNYDLRILNEAFYISSQYVTGEKWLFHKKVKLLKQLIEDLSLAFSISKIDELVNELINNNYQPFSHSLTYKNQYLPHYRLVKKSILESFCFEINSLDNLDLPFNKNEVASIKLINKGWSFDNKYHIILNNNHEYLLRLNDIATYKRKKEEFDIITKIYQLGINMSKPLCFKVSKCGEIVYSLFTWIKGDEALEKIDSYSEKRQYEYGLDAGRMLRKIHSIKIDENNFYYHEFVDKINRKIKIYQNCEVKVKHESLDFILQNIDLVKNTPYVLRHGDYHLSNMIIDEAGKLNIIDFNRFDYGDPYEEFDRLCVFSRLKSPYFAKGQIDGYFENEEIPLLFWRRLALYNAVMSNLSIIWSIKFGQKEIENDLQRSEMLYNDFNGFKSYLPIWYMEVKYES